MLEDSEACAQVISLPASSPFFLFWSRCHLAPRKHLLNACIQPETAGASLTQSVPFSGGRRAQRAIQSSRFAVPHPPPLLAFCLPGAHLMGPLPGAPCAGNLSASGDGGRRVGHLLSFCVRHFDSSVLIYPKGQFNTFEGCTFSARTLIFPSSMSPPKLLPLWSDCKLPFPFREKRGQY